MTGHTETLAPTTGYLLNTFLLLFCGVLVMFMAAGFAMLEAGSVRVTSVSTILIKNVALYSIAGIMFYLVGYNLMFAENNLYFGILSVWVSNDAGALNGDLSKGMADNAFWFFQMVFVATAASVVSGALAERVKLWSFLLFVVTLTGFIYPTVGHWTWGGGWLAELGFSDFAGSTIVHSVGGWAALAGVILLGARDGRFLSNGASVNLPNSSSPQVAIGVFILWFGWFGFNGGSQLAFQSVEDAVAIANIFVNTNVAAAGGLISVLVLTLIIDGKPNLVATLNGALAGLVSITADPVSPGIGSALLIGAIGGVVMIVASLLLERFKIDDAVGAIPVHLAAGIWGTMVVATNNPQVSAVNQLVGILSIGVFVFMTCFAIWALIKISIGIRICPVAEKSGPDLTEIGLPAYNLETKA
ncbi:MAG: ammonium transporter [Aestuariibacter sp.]